MDFFDWDTIKSFIEAFGWAKGILTIFFFLAHFWIFRQYNGRLEDRQKEIDRLAEDNREYRDRFLELLDNEFGVNTQKTQSN